MKKKSFSIISVLLLTAVFFGFFASSAGAAGIFEKFEGSVKTMIDKSYGGPEGSVEVGQTTFMNSLMIIINILLSFLGVVFFLLFLYAGYLWMTAQGNEEQVKKSKEMMKELVIALLIIFTARLFTEFLLTQVGNVIKANK